LKMLLTTATVVFIAVLIDVCFLHYQATVGKLPWKLKLLPDIGGQL